MQTFRLFLLMAVSRVVSAGDEPAIRFAAPTASTATTPVIGTLRVTLAMFIVLGAVLAAAWLTRRLRGGGSTGRGSLQVMAQVALGARERAVLLRVGSRQLLIGVAPGSVRTLHVLGEEAPAEDAADQPGSNNSDRPTFRSVLMRSLGK